MKNKYLALKKDIKKLVDKSSKFTKSHPYFVVIIMHELFRNLYYFDPYINSGEKNHFKRLKFTVDNLNNFANIISNIGSYKKKVVNENYDTQILFGKLWEERKKEKKLNSNKVLLELLNRAKTNINLIKGKKILDMGCGSGRFTNALAKLGCKLAVGIDLGDHGLKVAREFAKRNKIKNVKFIKASVLNLPFKDNAFDFVFCKGVLHHTGNLKKGLFEIKRILKNESYAFLYLYGAGGIFWDTRKLMRKVISKIPIDYTIKVLRDIGMPSRRTIFVDSWYVPIEEHVKKSKLENWFKKNNFLFRKYSNAKKIELEYRENKDKFFKEMYGSGELRYIIQKVNK